MSAGYQRGATASLFRTDGYYDRRCPLAIDGMAERCERNRKGALASINPSAPSGRRLGLWSRTRANTGIGPEGSQWYRPLIDLESSRLGPCLEALVSIQAGTNDGRFSRPSFRRMDHRRISVRGTPVRLSAPDAYARLTPSAEVPATMKARNSTPRRQLASVTEHEEYWEVFNEFDDYPAVRVGDKFWDVHADVLYEVVDVVMPVGQGVVRPDESVDEATDDLDAHEVRVVLESDHPKHDEPTKCPLDVFTQRCENDELLSHGANGWLPDKLAR